MSRASRSDDESTPPAEARRSRVAIALAIGLAAGVAAAVLHPAMAHDDFYQIWAGAKALLSARNPYHVVGPGLEYAWPWPLYYPAPAFLIAVPLVWLGPVRSGGVVFGAANLVLAYALQAGERRRLLLFASAAWIDAALFTQWAPLLTAALLVPSLGWAFAMKPNLGLALFLSRPTRAAAIGSVAVLLLSLVLLPTWPRDWLIAIRQAPHARAPIVTWPGPLLALALLRWRRFDARLLLALAIVPQTPHLCGTLPLFLIPETRAEMLLLVAAGYVFVVLTRTAFISMTYAQSFATAAPLIAVLIYIPCLVMILRRPNASDAIGERAPS